MVKVSFVTVDGGVMVVDAELGAPLMQAAVRHEVPGIDAECGGSCSCATCHVYVEEDWISRLGGATEMETSMLEFADNVRPESRLCCQIKVTTEMEGLTVRVARPAS
jgi:2Fe-2S ferredoxin